MKRSIIMMILLSCVLINLFSAQKVTIYCDKGYPPYSYMEANVAKGIYVDIIKSALKSLPDYEVTIQAVPWKSALSMIETGEGIAMFPPYYRPKDRPWMDYDIKLFEEEVVAFVKESNASTLKDWPYNFYGKKIGINTGFAIIKEDIKNKFTIDEGKDNKTNILKLNLNRIDAYLNDRIAIEYDLKKLRSSGELKETSGKIVSSAVVSKEAAFLSFTKKDNKFPFKNDFKTKLKNQIELMHKNGEIKAIVSKWTK